MVEGGSTARVEFDLTASFDGGADGLGSSSFSLLLTDNNGTEISGPVDSGLYSIAPGGGQGNAILLVNDNGVIRGYIDSNNDGFVSGEVEVLTASITVSSNKVTTVVQSGGIYHDPMSSQTIYITGVNLLLRASVTDGDGDSAHDDLLLSSALGFEDSGPTIDTPLTTLLVDNQLGLVVEGQINAQAVDTVAGYTLETNGTGDNGLTYSYSEDGSVMTATDSLGETVFILTVADDGTYSYELAKIAPEVQAFTPPFDSFTIPANTTSYTATLYSSYDADGNGIGDPLGDVIFSTETGKLQNSQDGLGVDSNLIGEQEVLVIGFDGATASNIKFSVGNINGSDPLAWAVYDSDGTTVLDSGVIVGNFVELDSSGNEVTTTIQSANNLNYEIDLGLNGLDEGVNFYSIAISAGTIDTTNGSGNPKYKFTGFEVEKVLTLDALNYTFDVQAVDGDGDLSGTASFNVIVDGSGHMLNGTAANDNILGSDEDNIIFGGDGDDVIQGGAGADSIYGESGSDALTGGAGSDTFIWSALDDGVSDTITDFQVGSGGDILDLSDILQTSDLATIDSMLSFALDGSDTVISVTKDGASQDIRLENVDLVTGAVDSEAIIQGLLTDGNLDPNNL